MTAKFKPGEIVMAHYGEGKYKPVQIQKVITMLSLHPMYTYVVVTYEHSKRLADMDVTTLGCPEGGLRKITKAEELLYL